MADKYNRADALQGHRSALAKNKKKLLATQDVCAICGKPINKKLKYPDPLSATVDHIIPIDKGGHPSDMNNLQLAHLSCNRQKSDKLVATDQLSDELIGNRVLPQNVDFTKV